MIPHWQPYSSSSVWPSEHSHAPTASRASSMPSRPWSNRSLTSLARHRRSPHSYTARTPLASLGLSDSSFSGNPEKSCRGGVPRHRSWHRGSQASFLSTDDRGWIERPARFRKNCPQGCYSKPCPSCLATVSAWEVSKLGIPCQGHYPSEWFHRGPSILDRSVTLFLSLLRPTLAILFVWQFSFLIN